MLHSIAREISATGYEVERAHAVTGFGVTDATLEAIAKRAEKEKANVFIAMQNAMAGWNFKKQFQEWLKTRKVKNRTLDWMLRAAKEKDWAGLGRALKANRAAVLEAVQTALDNVTSTPGSRKEKGKGKDE